MTEKFQSSSSVEKLLQLTHSPFEDERKRAVHKLQNTDEPETVDQRLIEMIEDESSEVRLAVLFALGRRQGADIDQALLKMREDNAPEVRKWAIHLTYSLTGKDKQE